MSGAKSTFLPKPLSHYIFKIYLGFNRFGHFLNAFYSVVNEFFDGAWQALPVMSVELWVNALAQ